LAGIVDSIVQGQKNSNTLGQSNYMGSIALLMNSGSRLQSNAATSYFPFGEVLSDLRLINPSEFSKRSWGIYLRLAIAKFLLAQSDFNLTGTERQSIQNAQSFLSARAKSLYLDTVKYEIKEKSALVQAMDPTLLDKALAALLKGEGLATKPNPVLIEQIRQLERLGAFTESANLRKNLEAYDRAIAVDNALEAVVDLMEFRRTYLLTLGRLKSQLQALATERTQLEAMQ
jgi:hypothetical protein